MPAGYSSTPLPRKLGIAPGARAALLRAPRGFEATLGPLPPDARTVRRPAAGARFPTVLAFCGDRAALADLLPRARDLMDVDGATWFCWPKKASGVVTDVSEADVRAAALAGGLVDVKICAVDETWSGLKCVFRLRDRDSVRSEREAHGPR